MKINEISRNLENIETWSLKDSRDRGCKRWSVYPPDVLDLTVAEMDLPIAEPILEVVTDAVRRQAFGYPIPDFKSGLPEIASNWLSGQNLKVKPSQIRMIADVIKAMVLALRHVGDTSGPVAVITPTYSRFLDAIEAAGRRPLEVPMRHSQGRYELDFDALDEALRKGATTVLLCNPSNPVGRKYSAAELETLSEAIDRYDVRLISDEIHAPLTYGGGFIPYASISRTAAQHSITLTSASKGWNIPGLRCALVILTGDGDAEMWDSLPRAAKGGISPLGIEATKAALEHGQPWLDSAMRLLDRNRNLIYEKFARAGHPEVLDLPESTYLAWLDLNSLSVTDPSKYLIEHAKVATTPGEEHGRAGTGFVRLNFASPTAIIEDATDRIVSHLGKNALA